MRILTGFIWDGKSGGIDAYLMAFARVARDEGVQLDFLTNEYCEELAAELDSMGHRLFEIATLRNRASQKRTIQSLCKQNSYDAAYFNISTALMYPVVKDARDAGVPKIAVHSHATDVDTEKYWTTFILRGLNMLLRRKLSRLTTHRFSCSDQASGWLFGEGGPSAIFIPNPVELSGCRYNSEIRLKMRQKLSLGDCFVVGSVTAMKAVKNPYMLIEAFAAFQKNCPKSHLLIVGDGGLRDEVEGYAKRRLQEQSVSFLGKRSDVGDLLQAFDVFLLTSKKEGLSIAAIEAQVAGLPCLLSSGVPLEAIVSADLVKRVPQGSSAEDWASEIAKICRGWEKEASRCSREEEAASRGFSDESPRKALDLMRN